MNEKKKWRLGDILLDRGMVSESDIVRALKIGKEKQLRIGEALIKLGAITEDGIMWSLAEQLNINFIRVADQEIDVDVVHMLPEEMERDHLLLPLALVGDELTLVVNDPLQESVIQEVSVRTGFSIRLALAKAADIKTALTTIHGAAGERARELEMESTRYHKKEFNEFTDIDNCGALFEKLISDCHKASIGVVHINIRQSRATIEFRDHGLVQPVISLNANWGQYLINNLRPDDFYGDPDSIASWKTRVKAGKKPLDLEVNLMPIKGGQTATVRVLDKRVEKAAFTQLGMTSAQRFTVDHMLKSPGLVLITGNSGSGRSTTVSSLLNLYGMRSCRIITVEPLERAEHSAYIHLSPDSLKGSDSGVKSLMAFDPDVVYFQDLGGEEEMEAALRAGLSGISIFTMLNFRRAGSALNYLTGLKIHPTLTAEGLSGIIAQRYLPTLCEACKVEMTLKMDHVAGLAAELKDSLLTGKVFRATGCDQCGNTGYAGRQAVFEIIAVDNKLRREIDSGMRISQFSPNFGEPDLGIPELVMEKIKEGVCAWTEILAFR
ncbi:MAG: Flp pilus assembly complex ATPase component [Desulfobacterales bacterium]|nr:Flp pilus assembly complex ATPase component [Desulfobacterales bacterium]